MVNWAKHCSISFHIIKDTGKPLISCKQTLQESHIMDWNKTRVICVTGSTEVRKQLNCTTVF